MSERAALARRAFEGFNDHEALEALVTDDVEIVPLRAAIEDISYRGREGIQQFWRDSDEAWSELSVTLGDVEERGERVIARGRLVGTARDSGVPVSMELRWEIDFRGDKICRLATVVE